MTQVHLARTRVAAQKARRRRVLLLAVFGLAGLVMPCAASSQRADDRTQFDARINVLDRSAADLSIQIERLNARDRELQHQLEKMRTNYDQRLERLEKEAAPKTPPPRRPKP
jgi:type II secretory pathway component PulM